MFGRGEVGLHMHGDEMLNVFSILGWVMFLIGRERAMRMLLEV